VLADDERGHLEAVSAIVGERFPSIAAVCAQAATFEREIAEQCGATPDGHPWLKPLRRHPPDHRPAAWPEPRDFRRDAYPFHHIGGDEVHEVAVGPVHAGIIEPGHFRFQAYGEEVL